MEGTSCEEVTHPTCLTQLFQCSKCIRIIISGPILQCSRGHLFCDPCLQETKECNICGAELEYIGCRGMEAMREVVEDPLQFGSHMWVIPDFTAEEITKIKEAPGLVNLIKEQMVCPVCLCYMAGNIYQCHEGHLLCEQCKKRLAKPLCPSCKEKFDLVRMIRCAALEKVNKVDVSECPFGGCRKLISLFQRSEHLGCCRFRKFECCIKGVNDCGMYYNSFELESHLILAHGVCYPSEVLNEVELVVSENIAICPHRMVINGFGRLFLLSTVRYINKSDKVPVYLIYLSMFGNKTESEDYICSVKITKEGGVLLWTGYCCETEECCQDFEKLSGLIFNERMAREYDRNTNPQAHSQKIKVICSLKRAVPDS